MIRRAALFAVEILIYVAVAGLFWLAVTAPTRPVDRDWVHDFSEPS